MSLAKIIVMLADNLDSTTILGHPVDSPFFISPCSRASYAHPDAELNLVQGAASANILYIVSSESGSLSFQCSRPVPEIIMLTTIPLQVAGYASLSFDEISAAASANQTLFSQLYFSNNLTANVASIKASEAAGAKAIVWTVDSPGSPDRQRAARFGVSSSNTEFTKNTWELYDIYRNSTSLPIVLKGIQNVEDARTAVNHGVPAIILSNHGGRNLDGSPSPLEIALEIYENDPEIFQQTEVLADGGVRYGTDALRLLALGVKAVSDPDIKSNALPTRGRKE